MSATIAHWIFLTLGLAGVLCGVWQVWNARASDQWPECGAVVLESSVQQSTGGRGGKSLFPSVRYEYRYKGLTYQGSRIVFSGGIALSSSQEHVEAFLRPLVPGARIVVRVCPADPRISVMEPGIHAHLKLLLYVSPYLVFMGAGGLLGWWH